MGAKHLIAILQTIKEIKDGMSLMASLLTLEFSELDLKELDDIKYNSDILDLIAHINPELKIIIGDNIIQIGETKSLRNIN